MVTRILSTILAFVLLGAASARADSYIRFGAGVVSPMGQTLAGSGSFIEDTGLLTSHSGTGTLNYGLGFNVSGGYGYKLSDKLAIEGSLDYAHFNAKSFANGIVGDNEDDNEDGKFGVGDPAFLIAATVNAIYTPWRFGAWSPYVGLGAGVGYLNLKAKSVIDEAQDTDGVEADFKMSKIGPAANAILGVEYALSDRWSADLRYRFTWVGVSQTNPGNITGKLESFKTHMLTVGAVYRF